MTIVILIMLLAWLTLNVAAPYSVFATCERISHGRLPAELLIWQKDRNVRFYMTKLVRGYGYSVWAPPYNIIVFDRDFFRHASSELIRFVIAHELAHFRCNHHKKRWVATVSGAVLLPSVRRKLLAYEEEADAIAEERTGLSRQLFPEIGHEV